MKQNKGVSFAPFFVSKFVLSIFAVRKKCMAKTMLNYNNHEKRNPS